MEQEEKMLKFFQNENLSPEYRPIAALFEDLAIDVVEMVAKGPERTVALRKLLEAKDAAVRAVVHPEG